MSIELITTDDLIIQSEGFMVSDMDGEKVMLSIENGKYYNLGQIGGRIWELLASPVTIASMVEQLVMEHEVEHDVCEKQVYTFMQQLASEGLVQVSKQ